MASRLLRAAEMGRAAGLLRPNKGRNTNRQLKSVPNNAHAASENHQRPTAVSGANCAWDEAWAVARRGVPTRRATPLIRASRWLRAAERGGAAGLLRQNRGQNTTRQLKSVPNNAHAASENHQRPTAVSGANCAWDEAAAL